MYRVCWFFGGWENLILCFRYLLTFSCHRSRLSSSYEIGIRLSVRFFDYCSACESDRLISLVFLNAAVICRCGVEQSSCKLIPSFVLELNFVSSKLYSICYHPKQTISNLISIKFQRDSKYLWLYHFKCFVNCNLSNVQS